MRERGLLFISERYVGKNLNVRDIRGEDIPGRISALENDPLPVVGITGDDLFANFLAKEYGRSDDEGGRSKLLIDRLWLDGNGPYEYALFGLPALCLLGGEGMDIGTFANFYSMDFKASKRDWQMGLLPNPKLKGRTVAIPRRYRELIKSSLPDNGEGIGFIPLEGKVDVTAARGGADYAIDIVVSGKTFRENGMGIFPRVLYLSDGVVLGNAKAKEKPSRGGDLSKSDRVSGGELYWGGSRARH